MDDIQTLTLRPLTARSIVLSTLLGLHPPELPARALVRVGALFGAAEGTVRVALTRMVAAGDLETHDGAYRLTDRLLARQARQDDSRARAPAAGTAAGRSRWSPPSAGRRPTGRAATGDDGLRLGELREGTWLRPANLVRPRPAVVTEQCTVLSGAPRATRPRSPPGCGTWRVGGPGVAAARGAGVGRDHRRALHRRRRGLRHLLTDPVLPARLLPEDWPGSALRRGYDAFERDFRAQLPKYAAG
ncbi:PaaX family transcriptional regulator C-terminal domain-containing protein [Streptomyces sp. M19]